MLPCSTRLVGDTRDRLSLVYTLDYGGQKDAFLRMGKIMMERAPRVGVMVATAIESATANQYQRHSAV